MDVDARLQLFDLKTKYQFQTSPGIDQYNMPLYNVQSEYNNPNPATSGTPDIGMFPVYQGFLGPVYINGVEIPFQTQKHTFFSMWPKVMQNLNVVKQGDGTAGPYTFQIPIIGNNPPPPNPPNPPVQGLLRGHVDITGIIATGVNVDPPLSDTSTPALTTINPLIPTTSIDSAIFITSIDATGAIVVVQDSGQFLSDNVNYGLLMQPGKAPYGNLPLPANMTNPAYSITSNTINYITGEVNVIFPVAIPQGQNINVQCYYFQTGLPRSVLYYNNSLTFRSPPAFSYLVELDAYLTPAAFFNSAAAIPFGYMAEYIARGAARKILSDTGDEAQFMFYEPLFKEQELLVWKRSQRQFTSTRTNTIYNLGAGTGANGNSNNYGAGIL